jgi:murein DD-endopeptidase MepM/ murein hydrolase activator NlpD
VTFAGQSGDYGNLIIVEHQGGASTYYAHLQSLGVKAGQAVEQGQRIGAVGSTGLATGPHLHFEVRDPLGRPVDPQPLLAKGLNLAA